MSAASPTILLVEDNDDDVFAMQRALRKAQVGHSLQIVNNGEKAMHYLSGDGVYADRSYYPLPALVFLDLKLPYVTGFEVLAWMREQPALEKMPVVVLSSSAEEMDRQRASTLGAYSYLVKPPQPQQLTELLNGLNG